MVRFYALKRFEQVSLIHACGEHAAALARVG
jgi:hypothetical protein